MVNLNHLYYFYLTHKMDGMTTAAKYLRISQSSLSVQIKSLENFFGVPLSLRRGRKLELTEDGEKVFSAAVKIFALAEDLTRDWQNSKSTMIRRCVIGVSSQVERPFVANIISPLLKDFYPQTSLEVVTGSDAELTKKLSVGLIDLLLTNALIYSDDIVSLAHLEIPVQLYVATSNLKTLKLAQAPTVKEVLKKSPDPLLLPHPNLQLRQETDDYMKSEQFIHASGFVSDLISVIEKAVIEGAGFAFLPEIYMRGAVQQKQVVAIGKSTGLWKHRLVLLARKSDQQSTILKKVADTLRAVGGSPVR